MARTRSIRRASSRAKPKTQAPILLRFLPEGLQAFVARRLVDIVALALVLSGGFVLFSLISYNAADPSWNTASGSDGISNWMGARGAGVADFLLQTVGIGGTFIGAALCIWGARIFNRQPLRPLWLRILSTFFTAICLSIACAQIPSMGWIGKAPLGGAGGALGFTWLEGLNFASSALVVVVASVCAVLCGVIAAVVRLEELKAAIMYSVLFVKACIAYAFGLIFGFKNWVDHHNDEDYRPDVSGVFKGLPKFQMAGLRQGSDDIADVPAPKARIAPPVAVKEAPPVLQGEAAQNVNPLPARMKPSIVTPQAGNAKMQSAPAQKNLMLDGDWELPPVDILDEVPEVEQAVQLNEDALRKNAELLQNVLVDYGVDGQIINIHPGPVVTLYELEPAPGTKSSKVIGLADDIARSMSAVSVRVAVVPGRNVIGIELPNKRRQMVYMRELIESRMFEKTSTALPLVLGKDIGGAPILADLAKMPHLLVAGTTGSGKSVAVNTMILSLLYRLSPEKCRFIMIDPKMLELSVYDGIPHLLAPVVTEPGKAVVSLKWTVNEMEERYRAMSKLGVRNIDGYNARIREALAKSETIMKKVQTGFDPETGAATYEDQPMTLEELPYIVVIVDEFADLMLVAGKDVESAIQRLAQMARAAGIHLIMATQRPSVDVITGVIKANFPTRISFQVTSKVDSRTILGEGGAEQLLGMGDMLYMAPGGRVTRVHGPFVSDENVEQVVNDLKLKAEPAYINEITEGNGDFGNSDVMNAMFGGSGSSVDGADELYDQAVALVSREGKVSISFVQRYLKIGYNRAASIVEMMEQQGVISSANSQGKREVLVADHSGVS
ncbi:MAG: DNA translocase FtsK 4TM domain-containing protein [Micavibrio sp.]|nr:DNA translocase FtsK 4TM domain-containing protein [Micavibrio sp.]